MNPLRILITTVGGTTSPDIIRSLKNNGERKLWIIGTDPYEFATGRFFVDEFITSTYSGDSEEQFVREIQQIINNNRIDVIVPCGNEDNLALSKYKDNFNCHIMTGDYDNLLRAYDKGDVYNQTRTLSPSHCPEFYLVKTLRDFDDACQKLGYPMRNIVVKPRFGRGGRGVYILKKTIDLDQLLSIKPDQQFSHKQFRILLEENDKITELILMEELKPKFSSVYSATVSGEFISLNHIREWGTASQTLRGVVEQNDKLKRFSKKLKEHYSLDYNFNIEMAEGKDGNQKIFDLNPRLSASSGIDQELGINFPYLSLKECIGEKPKVPKFNVNHKSRFVRFFDHVWSD